MRNSTSLSRRILHAALIAAVLALLPAVAAAQQTAFIWFPKFVCGFQQGNVPLLNDPNPPLGPDSYEDFKPGNYATTVNIVNTLLDPQTVNVYAMVTTGDPNLPSVRAPVASQVISGLLGLGAGFGSNFEIDCQDIADELTAHGLPPSGAVFEGNLLILPSSGTESLQVDGVYTFESQNAVERHVLWGDRGGVTTNFAEKGSGARGAASVPGLLKKLEPMEFPSGFESIAASGAAGLGLGASIDVERCPAIEVDISDLGGGGGTGGTGGVPALIARLDGTTTEP